MALLAPVSYLVTGGCGFIGRRLIHLLVNRGAAVRIIDNLQASTLAGLSDAPFATVVNKPMALSPGRIEIVVGDVIDAQLAIAATHQIDAVVHLAANTGVGPSLENPRKDYLTNVLGTFNYLEGCRANGVKRFVFASSSATVGEQELPISETAVPRPISPYAASKLAGEGYCSAYTHSFGVGAVTLRFGNVYGPGSAAKDSVVAKFIRRALNGQCLQIYGDGRQTRDFIYVDDLVEAIIAVLDNDKFGGEIFQIATAQETTIGEIAAMLMEAFESVGLQPVELCHLSSRSGDVKRSYADTSKAQRLLNWRAQTSLRNGLEQTLRWFIETQSAPHTQ